MRGAAPARAFQTAPFEAPVADAIRLIRSGVRSPWKASSRLLVITVTPLRFPQEIRPLRSATRWAIVGQCAGVARPDDRGPAIPTPRYRAVSGALSSHL